MTNNEKLINIPFVVSSIHEYYSMHAQLHYEQS